MNWKQGLNAAANRRKGDTRKGFLDGYLAAARTFSFLLLGRVWAHVDVPLTEVQNAVKEARRAS